MPRPLRIQYDNAYYHVMNRGKGRQTIFHGEAYYATSLKTLAEAHHRFGLEVIAYCLMGNHYHLFIKTPAEISIAACATLMGFTRSAIIN